MARIDRAGGFEYNPRRFFKKVALAHAREPCRWAWRANSTRTAEDRMDAFPTIPFPASYQRRPSLGWVAVRQLIEEVCGSLDSQMAAQRIEIVLDVPRSLGMMADRVMLRVALTFLVANAAEGMPNGGRLVITSFIGRDGLELEVADSGPSLLEFERQPRSSLSDNRRHNVEIVRTIVSAHGGQLRAANCPEGGVAYTLHFPGHAAKRAA